MDTQLRAAKRPDTLGRHVSETMRIGIPLAAAQLTQMAMGVTDTVFLGGLGPDALAIGGLASMAKVCLVVALQGILAAVSILVTQARGAGREASISGLYWTGILLTALLSLPAILLLSFAETLLLHLGEPAPLAHGVGAFVGVLRWGVPGALFALGLQRAFLPAIDDGWLILPVTVAGTAMNALLCYGLIHGAWGLPSLGTQGAAWATVLVETFMAVTLFALVHGNARRRALVGRARPPLPRVLGAMLRLGLPIGATSAVEAGLFFVVALMMGLLSPAALAAQQVALNTISVAFMIPLGLAQAANVRVGYCVGAGDGPGARVAGLVAMAIGAAFELVFATINLLAPDHVAALYLDPAESGAFVIAVALLRVSAVFQVADGLQCVTLGALRGLGDTSVPFALASLGYWGIGVPAAWMLAFHTPLGAAGAWCGLAAGLVVSAALLTTRFIGRSRRPQRFLSRAHLR